MPCCRRPAFDVHRVIDVSSKQSGRKTPAQLYGLALVRNKSGAPHSDSIQSSAVNRLYLPDTLLDGGSGITLVGAETAAQWLTSGFACEVEPLPSSIRGIRGIGALNHVQKWITTTVDIGGAFVRFHDIPVIKEHRGFLIGNDFLGNGRAAIRYDDNDSGTLTIRDSQGAAISSPVGFRISQHTTASSVVSFMTTINQTTAEANLAVDFGDISDEERAERMEQLKQAADVEAALRDVKPIGWTPETVEYPAWSEFHFKIRVPASLVKARDVLLLPLEDTRAADLGILVAPSIQRVDENGYAWCRGINLNKKAGRIPMLTPVVQFQVDPRVYNVSYEHTAEEILEKINLSDTLTDHERELVLDLVRTRRALFSSTLGYAHGYKMSIKVRAGSKPPNANLRPMSDAEEAAMNSETTKQWKAGLIEPCRSPYGALPILVKKPTKPGEPQAYRMVLDYRGVNAILEKDVYRLPNLATNLSRLGKANWFTTCDLLQGFHQIELADDGSKEITAFNTPMGQFQYARMPMGLASSPSTFMRLVDATLAGLPPGIALAYIDDIIIPTAGTFEDHMRDVGLVFDRLIEAGFTVRCDKTHIGLKEVPYLGFMVGTYGTRPLPEKTKAIFDVAAMDMHNNPVAAGRYAGMIGFYSKFIPDLQTLLAPFHDLKAKAAPVARILGDATNPPSLRFIAAFAATRQALADVTALARPDTTQKYYIHVDAASSCGIGGVLMQRSDPDDPESLRPIEFWSRRLSDEERGYGVRDQECLALSETLKQWRHYLSGKECELMSDHSSLQYLLSTAHADGSRAAGWANNVQGYYLTINYIPGRNNVVADFYSRSAKSNGVAQEMGPAGPRPSIHERLADTSTVTHICDVVLDAGGDISLPFIRRDDERSELSDAPTERAVAVGAVGTVRQALRVGLAVIRKHDDGRLDILVERDAGVTTLPAVSVDTAAIGFKYREQLSNTLRRTLPVQMFTLIKSAVAFKRRRDQSDSHYFVAIADDTAVELGSLYSFAPIDKPLIQEFSEASDSTFVARLSQELNPASTIPHVRNNWTGRYSRLRDRLHQPYSAVAELEDSVELPTIDEPGSSSGPAFCNTVAQGQRAIEMAHTRLRNNPGLSLALDLEGRLGGARGHIELLQMAVDPAHPSQKQLVFVLDIHNHGSALLGTGLLKNLLEDGGVPKIVHCSYGDASSLFNEYGIRLQGGFDTGVADCVLRGVGLNRQRRLDKVIHEYVPHATMQHKGTVEFVHGMFAQRPLPRKLFEYSYEDVIYCNELYKEMRAQLQHSGQLELVIALSALRAPPLALHPEHALYPQPTQMVVVLRDRERLICLQNHQNGQVFLPHGDFDSGMTDRRWQAQNHWAHHMGEFLKKSNENRMRKAVRLGDYMIVEAVVDDCAKLLASLRTAQELMGTERGDVTVVHRPLFSNHIVNEPQTVVMQYIRWQASISSTAEVNVVLGRTLEKMRVAVALYDESHVFCLTTAKQGVLQFPSCPLEIGAQPLHMAEKAIDLYAGPALRRRPETGLSLMPVTAAAIRKGFESAKELVTSGNTIYYGCYVPDLDKYRASFYASTLPLNGYRLTPTLQKRHPSFVVCTWETACKHLDPANDIAVAYALQPRVMESTDPTVQQAAVSQHSGIDTEDSESVEDVAQVCAVTQLPQVGVDPELDALLDAAVLCKYVAYMNCANIADVAVGQAVDTPSVARDEPPTPTAIRAEQMTHPATSRLMEYLEIGELARDWRQMQKEDRERRTRMAQDYFIDDDGVLCRRDPSNPNGLIVLPPKFRQYYIRQFHDRSGHFGVDKTIGLLRRRFYWGGSDVMRKEVTEWIRHCQPCQFAKVPAHTAGEGQIGFNGNHPGDVICGDVFYVGVEEDGFDHTLDFACFFSRRVWSDPLKGVPDAETVADTLLRSIIRSVGVPSEVRSDAGNNLIAAGIQLLYKRMGIKINVGTAYHHQLVALVERWHRTLNQLIRVHQIAVKKANWGSKWYRCIPLMELVFNNTINPSTKYSPFFLNNIRHARLPYDVLRANPPVLPKHLPDWVQQRLDDLNVVYDAAAQSLRLNAIAAKRRYDLRHEVNLWYKPGDRVLLVKGSVTDKRAIKPKATVPMDGPFTISKALPNDRYVLSDLKTRRIRDTVHVSRLVPYFPQLPDSEPAWMLKVPPTNGSWPIHSVVGRRVHKLEQPAHDLGLAVGEEVLQYKVRWLGYDRSWDTWRPVQSLASIMELINEYDSLHPPPADLRPLLERADRTVDPPVEATDHAKQRKHMRARPHSGQRPAVGPPHDAPTPHAHEPVTPANDSATDSRLQRRLARAQRLAR
jgi:hypothetical protein